MTICHSHNLTEDLTQPKPFGIRVSQQLGAGRRHHGTITARVIAGDIVSVGERLEEFVGVPAIVAVASACIEQRVAAKQCGCFSM